MSNRKQESYAALFAIIKSLIPNWTAKKIHLDYEVAIANAFVKNFPEVQKSVFIIYLKSYGKTQQTILK